METLHTFLKSITVKCKRESYIDAPKGITVDGKITCTFFHKDTVAVTKSYNSSNMLFGTMIKWL